MAQMKLEHNGITPAGTELYLLNMGPQHPSTHGVLRVLLELDGETVVGGLAAASAYGLARLFG